ncbi:hypothetical protein LCGC14_2904350, partial [marine sediment metagenome]
LQGEYGKDPWAEFRAKRMKQRVGDYDFRLKSIPLN